MQGDPILINEGHFREFFRYRILSGHELLKTHLETISSRATYIGKNMPNSLMLWGRN